jgi:demethylmenaquinone methyltransferase/2-methoxy-6-polyprenyl-1,4-benzoquinol methylase
VTSEWDTKELLEGEEKVTAVRHMFDAIAPKYDRLNRIISFRLDVRWRKRTVRDLGVDRGARVLDLASGTGDLCIDLARVGVRPISIDLSFGMLSADRSGVPRVQTASRCPVPRSTVSHAVSHCATSPTCPRSSQSWAAWFALVVGSRCSM